MIFGAIPIPGETVESRPSLHKSYTKCSQPSRKPLTILEICAIMVSDQSVEVPNMNIQLIVTLVAAVYFLAFIGIYLLKSRKKHWAMTLIRLCATVVAAIVAIPVCPRDG